STEDRIHLVEEHDDRCALACLLPGPLEDQTDVTFGLTNVLVEQLRTLDVEEEALAHVLAGAFGHLFGQRVGHRLGDERLTATGGTVQKHTLGWAERE